MKIIKELSGKANTLGVVRSTETTAGPTKLDITGFNTKKHFLSYKEIAGTPFFAEVINAKWSLTKIQDASTKLILDFEIKFKGIGGILTPKP